MTTIVYILLFLGTKANTTSVNAYTETLVFTTETACQNAKQLIEVRLRSKFDKIEIDCRKREVLK